MTCFKQTFVGNVLTPLARQGIFRFFPGADNQNVTANNPDGRSERQSGEAGERDRRSSAVQRVQTAIPYRPGYDPTGFMQNTLLARMPLPNDYTVGDGLNTAGIRFTRRIYGLDTHRRGNGSTRTATSSTCGSITTSIPNTSSVSSTPMNVTRT